MHKQRNWNHLQINNSSMHIWWSAWLNCILLHPNTQWRNCFFYYWKWWKASEHHHTHKNEMVRRCISAKWIMNYFGGSNPKLTYGSNWRPFLIDSIDNHFVVESDAILTDFTFRFGLCPTKHLKKRYSSHSFDHMHASTREIVCVSVRPIAWKSKNAMENELGYLMMSGIINHNLNTVNTENE